MSTAPTSSQPIPGAAVSMASVDHAIDLAAPAIASSRWSEALRFHDIDLLDAARSPIFIDLLAAARTPERHARPPSEPTRWGDRLRRYAIDRQLPGPVVEWRAQRRSHRPPRDAILAWPREPTHVEVLRPVVAALSRATPTGYIVCQPRLFEPLAHDGTPPALTRAEWPDLVRRVETAIAPIFNRLEEPLGTEIAAAASIGLTSERMERTLCRTLVRQLPTILETILATERIADDLAPQALLVGNDLTIEGRAATHAAQASGIPTVSLMHGAVTGDPLQRHHIVDRFLVYGERSRRSITALGLPAERIVVTGNPRLIERPAPSATADPRVARLGGIAPGQPWILIASSGPGHRTSLDHHRRFVGAIDGVARALPAARFVAKLHRKDRPRHYPSAPHFAVVPHACDGAPSDIFTWLRGPSAVVTGASTVAIEAMLMGVPVLTVDLADELSRVDFIEAGATIHCRTEADLERCVRETLERGRAPAGVGQRAEAFLRETFAHLDGDPVTEAAEAIRGLT